MEIRERYIAVVLGEKTDKIPFSPGRARKSTIINWHNQGLPEGEEWFDYLSKLLEIDTKWLYSDMDAGIDFRMIPKFEEKILDESERNIIVQDWKGNICEISKEYDPSYLRDPIDFVTRRWIKCPVKNWADWEQMKLRYDPYDAGRLTEDFDKRCEILKNQEQVVSIFFDGPFMQLRDWMGFEGLCMGFMDNPGLIRNMINFYCEYISRMFERILKKLKPDYVHCGEDMAYKGKSMISPEFVRELFFPVWKQWGEIIHDSGCKIFDMDSDGYIGELIPIWVEAGFDITDPVEIAAGNDLMEYKERFGLEIAYLGGVDKRAIAAGGDMLKEEIKKIKSIIKFGKYIPSCDHGIPNDVSWKKMIEYSKLLAETTGWL
jgi:uroporphyrinogen decarboxylase